MERSRTISITVTKSTGEAFDAIIGMPPRIMPDAQMGRDGWWSFTGPFGRARLRFDGDRDLGILDHTYVDDGVSWDIPMRVVPSGDCSEVTITLNKPDGLTDAQFDERAAEVGQILVRMKEIIESGR